MLNRQKSNNKDKDIRSRIKHENVNLGAGTEMGGQPAGQGLHSNVFNNNIPYRQNAPLPGHNPTPSVVSNHSYVSSGPMRMTYNVNPSQDFVHQSHPLGAGPSFVSLSPSDSISNFEGRPGGITTRMPEQLYEPSAGSTASFAQGLAEPSTPLRPIRSVRRPQQQLPQQQQQGPPALPSATRSGFQPALEPIQSGERSASPAGRNLLARKAAPASLSDPASEPVKPINRHARSARLMAQVVNQQDGRATPNSINSEDDSALGHAESVEDGAQYATKTSRSYDSQQAPNSYDSQMTVSPPLGSLSRSEEPAALSSVLNALTQAGRKKGQARILRGTTAEEESKRRKSERKVEQARKKEARPLENYIDRQDERPFREICAVLRKVQEEWGFVVEDDFSSVALALSLLDDSSLGANRQDFVEVKELIERSLQGTVDGESILPMRGEQVADIAA
jgi:exocyst complex component 4